MHTILTYKKKVILQQFYSNCSILLPNIISRIFIFNIFPSVAFIGPVWIEEWNMKQAVTTRLQSYLAVDLCSLICVCVRVYMYVCISKIKYTPGHHYLCNSLLHCAPLNQYLTFLFFFCLV